MTAISPRARNHLLTTSTGRRRHTGGRHAFMHSRCTGTPLRFRIALLGNGHGHGRDPAASTTLARHVPFPGFFRLPSP